MNPGRVASSVTAAMIGAAILGGCTSSQPPKPTPPTRTRTTSPSSSTSAGPEPTATTSAPAPSTEPPETTSSTPAPVAPVLGIVDTGVGWSSTGLEGAMPAPGTCRYRTASDGYALPDIACTPGAVDTAVTESNIQSTICSAGFTSSVRPPESMTEPSKYRSMDAYDSPGSASGYEYDHLVPLELGGSSDVRNLWPEPDVGSPSQFDSSDDYGENAKDGVEDRLNSVVCAGQVTLAAAQQAIAANWTTAESALGVSP